MVVFLTTSQKPSFGAKTESLIFEVQTAEKMNNRYSTCQLNNLLHYYFIIILKVDISSLIKKAFHHSNTVTFSSQVQGSHLMKRNEASKYAKIQLTSNLEGKVINASTVYNFPISLHCTTYSYHNMFVFTVEHTADN